MATVDSTGYPDRRMRSSDEGRNQPYLLRRLAAGFYDTLLITGLWMMIGFVTVGLGGGEAIPSGTLWFQILLFALAAAFFIMFWCSGGQTLGMRAWRLQLATDEGNSIPLRTAMLRFVCACVSLGALGAGFFWALFDRDGLTWHDRVCGTRMKLLPSVR